MSNDLVDRIRRGIATENDARYVESIIAARALSKDDALDILHALVGAMIVLRKEHIADQERAMCFDGLIAATEKIRSILPV